MQLDDISLKALILQLCVNSEAIHKLLLCLAK